jgi:hypothetical protein
VGSGWGSGEDIGEAAGVVEVVQDGNFVPRNRESRQQLCDFIAQAKPAFLHEQINCRRGEDLGDRGEGEHAVLGGRHAQVNVGQAKGLLLNHFAVPQYQEHQSGEVAHVFVFLRDLKPKETLAVSALG